MIDLHIHSKYSDGSFEPNEIFQMAKENNFKAISITDHDSIDNFEESEKISAKMGIEFVPGVEISSSYSNSDIHLLAYYPNVNNKTFVEMIKETQFFRKDRARKILNNLKQFNFHIEFAYLNQFLGKTKNIGRLHIAKALIKKGYCESYKEVFEKYIGDGCPANVPKTTLDADEVIKICQDAGALTVVAHPSKLKEDSIILDLIKMGIDGLEVKTPMQTHIQECFYSSVAKKFNLLQTGGSDFHYQTNYRKFGDFYIEYEYLTMMKDLLRRRNEKKRNFRIK